MCGCLLLLLTSQTALAFQPCSPPSTQAGQATICAERSTKSYQNIVSLVCYPGAGWTGTQFFRMNDYRIVSYQTETDAYGSSATYMVFELSPALDEGTYICRNAALTSSTSTNNVTLIGKIREPYKTVYHAAELILYYNVFCIFISNTYD